ncbi:hypothetical protein BKA69DRAFT_1081451 [Paraphysoderma sedebokerense]|nr:hypothetical protein BKA69DRAFT_1081451 [Paraphysoderma sedebokerense]
MKKETQPVKVEKPVAKPEPQKSNAKNVGTNSDVRVSSSQPHKRDQGFIQTIQLRLTDACRKAKTPCSIRCCEQIKVDKVSICPDFHVLNSSNNQIMCVVQTHSNRSVAQSDIDELTGMGATLKCPTLCLIVEKNVEISQEVKRLCTDRNIRLIRNGGNLTDDFCSMLNSIRVEPTSASSNIGRIYITKNGKLDGNQESSRQFIQKYGNIAFAANKRWDTEKSSVKELMKILEQQGELQKYSKFCM